jgi:predicted kinase
MVLDAGWSVVVDAAFLKRHERDSFRALAAERGADFAILACSAPLDEMRHRLETRQHDASEATVEVLERQLDWVEPWLPTKPPLCIPMLDPEQGRRGPRA